MLLEQERTIVLPCGFIEWNRPLRVHLAAFVGVGMALTTDDDSVDTGQVDRVDPFDERFEAHEFGRSLLFAQPVDPVAAPRSLTRHTEDHVVRVGVYPRDRLGGLGVFLGVRNFGTPLREYLKAEVIRFEDTAEVRLPALVGYPRQVRIRTRRCKYSLRIESPERVDRVRRLLDVGVELFGVSDRERLGMAKALHDALAPAVFATLRDLHTAAPGVDRRVGPDDPVVAVDPDHADSPVSAK